MSLAGTERIGRTPRHRFGGFGTKPTAKEHQVSSVSDGGQRGKDRSRDDEAAEVDESTREQIEKQRERAERRRAAMDAEDILDDIDDTLRASLGLDREASD